MQMEVRIFKMKRPSPVKAFAHVSFEGKVNITGFRIIVGKNGAFVGWPSQKDPKTSEFRDTVYALDDDFKQEVEGAIMQKWNQEAGSNGDGVGPSSPAQGGGTPPPAPQQEDEDEIPF